MKNAITYKAAFGCIIILFCCTLTAQQSAIFDTNTSDPFEAHKRKVNYQELKGLGYKDVEIFEDLANANFLMENYETALFWYEKLLTIDKNKVQKTNHQERYKFALEKAGRIADSGVSASKDWQAEIRKNYETAQEPVVASNRNIAIDQKGTYFLENQILADNSTTKLGSKDFDKQQAYKAPIAITADGKTAYFSKIIYEKPEYGIFSKKEKVHKIFRANNINGQWRNVKQIAVCPKNFSAQHPSISPDGKRLFFASNMPGTYGAFDIYVAKIHKDGSLGVARNLGDKVNTKKDDLYPNLVGGSTLFFASAGHKGYGGLDVHMAQVGQNNVGLSVNLGSSINSKDDDFSIYLMTEKGLGYVISNRGENKETIRSVAFSYDHKKNKLINEKEYNILAALNNNLKVDYTTSVFEDE